jgi:hypothetical protein
VWGIGRAQNPFLFDEFGQFGRCGDAPSGSARRPPRPSTARTAAPRSDRPPERCHYSPDHEVEFSLPRFLKLERDRVRGRHVEDETGTFGRKDADGPRQAP